MDSLENTYANQQTDTFGFDFSIFNEPVKLVLKSDFAECAYDAKISEAASLLSQKKTTAILIRNELDTFTGIITDKDFREKVIAKNISSSVSVSQIMSSPLISVIPDTTVFEAISIMIHNNIKHLIVKDKNGEVKGILSDHQIVTAQGHSPLHLLRQIAQSENLQQLISVHGKLVKIVNQLMLNGTKIGIVNRLVTNVSDEILKRIIKHAVQELGKPPAPFAFIVMGSEGRKEQTLKTDQDNAIIFQDSTDPDNEKYQKYFLQFGGIICSWLDKAGYKLCNGDVMAQNPKWCQPLSQWKKYFDNWIHMPEPLALMHSSIFFDFRYAYGEVGLVDNLKKFLFDKLSGRIDLFFYHLAQNAIHSEPLLGIFNKIKVEKSGQYKNAFDIKKAMTPIVDFVRIYSLHNNIEATNTIDRLSALNESGIFNKQEYEDYIQAYNFLMYLRFMHQLENIRIHNVDADNYIRLKNLSHIEQQMLKEIFKLIKKIQQKMSVKFTAIA